MSPKEQQISRRIMAILMPYAKSRLDRLRRRKKRLVHYTSAENLFRILTSATLWLRNTHCMVDYMEVQHGYQLLLRFFNEGTYRQDFCSALNNCHAGLGEQSLKLFDEWWENIRFNTYISSISEHENDEDEHGRLSMWRAFGGQAQPNAAAVLNIPEFGAADGLGVLLSPVAYFDYVSVEAQLRGVTRNLTKNVAFLSKLPADRVRNHVFFALVSAAVSLKHEGFREEKEWRMVYLPYANRSALIQPDFVVVSGVPQPIFKIPLKEDPQNNVVGMGIPALLDRIIIGPTMYGAPIFTAFVELLRARGVTQPETRVVFSRIPIRP